jgi:hypothetical protein
MTALALALHILGAVVWVGGMFAIYVCLRPALGTLEPPQRLRLMRVTFQKFFPWVWIAILLLLASGYWMVFTVFGGFAGARLHVHDRSSLNRGQGPRKKQGLLRLGAGAARIQVFEAWENNAGLRVWER